MKPQLIEAFDNIGNEIRDGLNGNGSPLYSSLKYSFDQAYAENGWFTAENIDLALEGISSWLTRPILESWMSSYNFPKENRNVGIVMAGNIPLVGFHDFLCVLLSGNTAQVKLSSTDKVLLPILAGRLKELVPELGERIRFVERIKAPEAVIATGSNNTSRYFEYYFKDVPHIIRKSRNSIAMLDGSESEDDLRRLGEDVFTFFGLGCRNVSKVLLPHDFDLDRIFGSIVSFSEVANNNKYANNYDYYKAIYMLSKADLLENGFLMVKEDESLHSPVSMLFYQRYSDRQEAVDYINSEKDNLQCIVSADSSIENRIDFGASQKPKIEDYADGVDTMEFLSGV